MNAKEINKTINERVYSVEVVFETVEQCQAYIASFPKAVGKIYATSIRGVAYDREYPLARFEILIKADGVNGGVNETGLKRIAKFEEIFATLNIQAGA